MRPGGFEPPTNSLEGCCSIHLSYGRLIVSHQLRLLRLLVNCHGGKSTAQWESVGTNTRSMG